MPIRVNADGSLPMVFDGEERLILAPDVEASLGGGGAHPDLATHISLGLASAASFSRGGTLIQSDGMTVTPNIVVWQAPFACTVTAVKGYRVGGTGATVNARKNGTLDHLATAVSLTSADAWADGGAVQNAAYVAGDKLEIMIVTVTGGPTQAAVQVNFTKP